MIVPATEERTILLVYLEDLELSFRRRYSLSATALLQVSC
jgi:hypothetical protein